MSKLWIDPDPDFPQRPACAVREVQLGVDTAAASQARTAKSGSKAWSSRGRSQQLGKRYGVGLSFTQVNRWKKTRQLAVFGGLLEGVGELDQHRLRPGAAEK